MKCLCCRVFCNWTWNMPISQKGRKAKKTQDAKSTVISMLEAQCMGMAPIPGYCTIKDIKYTYDVKKKDRDPAM